MRHRKETRCRKMKTLSIAILILTAAVGFSTVVFASYSHRATLNTYFASAESEFYFTSDFLLPSTSTLPVYYITHDWQTNSKATIHFDLRNYENALNVSNQLIAYEVESDPASDPVSGTLLADAPEGSKQTIGLEFTNPDPQAPLEVTIVARALSPYSETLHGKFIISPDITYSVNDNTGSPLAILTVQLMPDDIEQTDVVITWAEGAAPDMTNRIVKTALDESSIDLINRSLTTTLNTAAVYELIFFKDELDLYDGITVTK